MYVVRNRSHPLFATADKAKVIDFLLAQFEEGYPIDIWTVYWMPDGVEVPLESMCGVTGTEFLETFSGNPQT